MKRFGFVYLGAPLLALMLLRPDAGAESGLPGSAPERTDAPVLAAPGRTQAPNVPEALDASEARDAAQAGSTTVGSDRRASPPATEIELPTVRTNTSPTPRPEGESRRRRRINRYPGPIPTPADWTPPEGPVRIGIQAGHWRAHEAPAELSGLRDNGTRWEDIAEWELNLDIAERTARMLRERGYEVDLLPAVVPPGYRSHLFISIHADGSADPRASGYRVAAPRLDTTGRAGRIAALLEESYGDATGLKRLPTVTRRMQNYYAFNFRRYEHALHPMTIAVILETGFLTSAADRQVILADPDRAARGIVAAVTRFPETPAPLAATVAGGR